MFSVSNLIIQYSDKVLKMQNTHTLFFIVGVETVFTQIIINVLSRKVKRLVGKQLYELLLDTFLLQLPH